MKVKKDWSQKYSKKLDKRKKTLRSPLNIGEKALVLTERLKKKDAPGKLYKNTTKKKNKRNLIEIEYLL